MVTQEDDPIVSLEDISAIQRFLFKRWLPAFAKAGLQILALVAFGGAGLFLFLRFMYSEWSTGYTLALSGLTVFAIGLLPYTMYVSQMMWLDFRIFRRLQGMATRVRAGETVHASEVRL
jgi:hypothetical protein